MQLFDSLAICRCFNEQLPWVGVLGWEVGCHWFLAAWLGAGVGLAAKGESEWRSPHWLGQRNLFLSGFTQPLSTWGWRTIPWEALRFPSDNSKWIHSLEFVMGKTYPFRSSLHYHTGVLQESHCERDAPAEPNASLIQWEAQHWAVFPKPALRVFCFIPVCEDNYDIGIGMSFYHSVILYLH